VTLPTLSVLAAGLLSCSHLPGQQRRVCVDARQTVIDPRQCTEPGGIGRYYYYNGGGSSFLGSHVSGGSFSSGSHFSSSSSGSSSSAARSAAGVGRGGFGGHASGG
jgi:hypothetical protein